MSDRFVQKARTILKSERGSVRKEWGGRTSVCLVYPNHYFVGMSNLGFQTIYGLLNDQSRIVCERAFLPTAEDLEILQKDRSPLLSLESHRPLSAFELLAFSLSYENDFINLLAILQYARIPLESSKRRPEDPLVVAGGVTTFLNPEPLADFVDVFLLGEAEELLLEFLEAYQEAADQAKADREAFLKTLANLDGAYVPRFYRPDYRSDGSLRKISIAPSFPGQVKKRFVENIDARVTTSVIRTPHTEFGNMTLLEVNRGCARGCRFCSAGFLYRPYRNRSLEALKRAVEKALETDTRIGLTGAAVSDHPGFEDLCEFIVAKGGTFSLASVRLDRITERLGRLLEATGIKTVAMAPEAGSQRLRTLLHKGITEDDILRASEILLKSGIANLRLYFLIGIPSETEDDVDGIVRLTRTIKHRMLQAAKSTRRLGRITLSINSLVPKPSTPFQWAPFEDVTHLRQKLTVIRNGLRREPNVEVTHDVPKWAYVQSLLSRGDRQVGQILLAAHQTGGDWRRAFRQVNINPDFYVYRERSRDELFPWDFIDQGTTKAWLWEQYEKAIKG
jgi:radical SAM family uncharacterized protein